MDYKEFRDNQLKMRTDKMNELKLCNRCYEQADKLKDGICKSCWMEKDSKLDIGQYKAFLNKYGFAFDKFLRNMNANDNLTAYEKRHGIKIEGVNRIMKSKDLCLYSVEKSDGTRTLIIGFRVGLGSKNWLKWIISENQAKLMRKHFWNEFTKVENFNSKVLGKPLKYEDR